MTLQLQDDECDEEDAQGFQQDGPWDEHVCPHHPACVLPDRAFYSAKAGQEVTVEQVACCSSQRCSTQ